MTWRTLGPVPAAEAQLDGGSLGELAEPKRPPIRRGDRVAMLLPAFAVAVQVLVLEFYSRPAGPSATNRTSTSLVRAGSSSTCHCVLMSQLITNRVGGS